MAESSPGGFVEVVYALPQRQAVVSVPIEPGLTAGAAIERSGLRGQFPEIVEHELVIGVYSRRVDAGYVLAAGDRVEICRPLRADPRQMRRDLVAEGRVMGGDALERGRDATTQDRPGDPGRS